MRTARSRIVARIAVAVLAIALLGAACSSNDAEPAQPTPEPQTLEQYFSGLQTLFDTYETRTDEASAQIQGQFSGATDAESAIEQALELFPQLMAMIIPILGDLVDGLAATSPPAEVASAHADLLEAQRGVQGMLADLAARLERGEDSAEIFAAFTSDASGTALGQQLAAAASELQSIAATNGIALDLSAAGGTSSGSTQRPPSTDATLVLVQVLTPDRGSSFTVEAGELFTLAVGATAAINGERFAVRFDGIEGDSRCPSDVSCIRAGEAFATLAVTSRAGEALFQIAVPPEGPTESIVAGWKITVVELTPQAISTQTIEPADYELHLYLQPTDEG